MKNMNFKIQKTTVSGQAVLVSNFKQGLSEAAKKIGATFNCNEIGFHFQKKELKTYSVFECECKELDNNTKFYFALLLKD